MNCTCNWNALGPAPRCPVHDPPACTCDRCPCCGGVKVSPPYRFDWTYRPAPWRQTPGTWIISDTTTGTGTVTYTAT